VLLREALGSEVMAHFTIPVRPARTEDVRELAADIGDDRAIEDLEEGESAEAEVVGRFNARTRIKPGDQIEVAVDTRGLHFFDPETGLGIYNGTMGKEVE